MSFTFHTWLCVLVCSFISTVLAAQAPESHKKKQYIAPDSTLYHPLSEPFYLHVGTSANKTDLSLNQTNGTANTGVTATKSGKLYFDLVKHNGFRIPGRRMIIVDGSTPISKLSFFNAPKAYRNGQTYFGKGLQASIESNDSYSGVKQLYQALNSSTFVPYTGSLTLNQEGEQALNYYAVDHVGNVETVKQNQFVVDLSPPTSTFEKLGQFSQDILSNYSKIKLLSTDNLSGLSKIEWRLNQGRFRKYQSPIALNQLKDGVHQLSYKATDFVKNEERIQNYDFAIDRIPPTVQFQFVGEYFVSNRIYISKTTDLQLFSIDNRSGVQAVFYRLDQQKEQQYQDLIQLKDTTGTHAVYYYATDLVGNSSKNQFTKVQFTIDHEAPTFQTAYEGPHIVKDDTLYIREFTKISPKITDQLSGLQSSTYRIDEGLAFPYKGALRIRDEGFHQVTFDCTDWVNNHASYQLEVYVDRLPPKIAYEVQGDSVEEREINGEIYQVYQNSCEISMTALDDDSGVDETYYVINSGLKKNYSDAIHNFRTNTAIILELFANDQLGNVSRQVIRLYIEK